MNIFIDIGHPAHVHYFRNFIRIMRERNHRFLVTARNREQVFHLLKVYDIDFHDRGTGSEKMISKLAYLLRADFFLYHVAKSFDPDLFLSFGSMYAAHTSKLLGKPHIAFDDTEHSKLEHLLYMPFTNLICTPACFNKDLGAKHVRFNGYMELCHLHPNYFKPDRSILRVLGVKDDEKYVVIRFISWKAGHDARHFGIREEIKLKAVRELSKHARVFISAENELPHELKPYELRIPPERIHDVLYFAELFFGESGTMATEAALLGTPSVRVSTIAKLLGNYRELRERYRLIEFYDSDEEGLRMALSILQNGSKGTWQRKRLSMLEDKIDVTQFMVDTVAQFN